MVSNVLIERRTGRAAVILLTAYPPEYGGISVSCRRLFHGLKRKGVEVRVVAENRPVEERDVEYVGSYSRWLLSSLLRRPEKETIVHYHSHSWPIRAALGALAAWGKFRCVLTVHNARAPEALASYGIFGRRVFLALARKGVSHWIAVSEQIRDQLMALGVKAERITVIPGFIPPTEEEINAPLPADVARFIDSHDPVCSSLSFRLAFHKGEDLYGVDLCMEATRRLLSRYPRLGFIFCIPSPENLDYLAALKRRAAETSLGENFLLYDRAIDSACSLWRQSTLFVRATNTDGDPLSVREALYVGTPVVASDAVDRPSACVLFRNRDVDSLVCAIEGTIGRIEQQRREVRASIAPVDTLEQIMGVYRKVWAGSRR